MLKHLGVVRFTFGFGHFAFIPTLCMQIVDAPISSLPCTRECFDQCLAFLRRDPVLQQMLRTFDDIVLNALLIEDAIAEIQTRKDYEILVRSTWGRRKPFLYID